MIERYTRPAMAAVWSDAHRLETWLDVEVAVTATSTSSQVPSRRASLHTAAIAGRV